MEIGRFLFVSINSKPMYQSFNELKEDNLGLSLVWKNYCSYVYNIPADMIKDDNCEICWMDKAHFVPEFCKLNLINLGFLSQGTLKVKEITGDEKEILNEFNNILEKVEDKQWIICGWNIKNYDIPLLNKRFLINKINPHSSLPKSDTKPWEMKHIFDLKEFWNGLASRGINSIDAPYYSICKDSDTTIMEGTDQELNSKNEIIKMFNIIKEFSKI